MAQDILPDKQNIDAVFSNTAYYIDFYQREYKWNSDQVSTLLDDLFHKFRLGYGERSTREANPETIEEFPWYYLNTLITNQTDGRTYVVDGQQRLTTLTLVTIALFHRLEDSGSKLTHWVRQKIVAHSADGKVFWMGQGKRQEPLTAIFDRDEVYEFAGDDVTAAHMRDNYRLISAYLEGQLRSLHELEMFTLYFLKRVVLVNLQVAQTDVPMVFEVINDRGIGLKSHEILKGKLLGQISKAEVDQYAEIWESCVNPLDINGDADKFFQTLFKALLPISRKNASSFDQHFQRTIFEPEHDATLGLKANPRNAKQFIANDLRYYQQLYRKMWQYAGDDAAIATYPHIRFNGLNEMDLQVLLALGACGLRDPDESKKIAVVSRELDRLFVLLQLNKAYDSRRFTDLIYRIRDELRSATSAEYRPIFESVLIEQIKDKRASDVATPFSYSHFRRVGYEDLGQRFIRYFFARIEHFIATETSKQTQSSFYEMVRSDRRNSSFHHVEHILANNDENIAMFESEEEFERERNRLGALLLLRGRDNQSSGNESYLQKRQSYAGSLYWNQTLCDEFYKSKLDNRDFLSKFDLPLTAIDVFDSEAIEQRTQALFHLVQIIWE